MPVKYILMNVGILVSVYYVLYALFCRLHVVIGLVGACMFCAIPSLASQLMDTASNQLGAYAAMGLQYMTGKVGTAVKGGTSSAAGKASSEKGMLGKMASVGAKKAASISNMMKGGKE